MRYAEDIYKLYLEMKELFLKNNSIEKLLNNEINRALKKEIPICYIFISDTNKLFHVDRNELLTILNNYNYRVSENIYRDPILESCFYITWDPTIEYLGHQKISSPKINRK